MRNEELMSCSYATISENLVILVGDCEEDSEMTNRKERVSSQVTDVCAGFFPARNML